MRSVEEVPYTIYCVPGTIYQITSLGVAHNNDGAIYLNTPCNPWSFTGLMLAPVHARRTDPACCSLATHTSCTNFRHTNERNTVLGFAHHVLPMRTCSRDCTACRSYVISHASPDKQVHDDESVTSPFCGNKRNETMTYRQDSDGGKVYVETTSITTYAGLRYNTSQTVPTALEFFLTRPNVFVNRHESFSWC